MKNVIGLSAGLVLAAGAYQEVEAATFTPDMWVYELTYTFDQVWVGAVGGARATVDATDPIPEGCTAFEASTPQIELFCDMRILSEIDLDATLDPSFARTRVGRIGFNASTIVCDSGVLGGCPPNANEEFLDTGSTRFDFIALTAELGRLSYRAFMWGPLDSGEYELSSESVSGRAGNVQNELFGFWNFGTDGRWWTSSDPQLNYSVEGRLISAPTMIPLPAPVLMLSAGLAALGALRARSKRRGGAAIRLS